MKTAKILFVENCPDQAELIIPILEGECNRKVLLKKDGQEAIDYFRKCSLENGDNILSKICLVILDLNISKAHGMEVLKFLKGDSKLCSIPIVILSASFDPGTIAEAYKNGADSFMMKPNSYEGLTDRIKSINHIMC